MFGGRDSHPSNRYSRQHTRFQNLQHSFRCTFIGDWNAPLPHRSRKSGVGRRIRLPWIPPSFEGGPPGAGVLIFACQAYRGAAAIPGRVDFHPRIGWPRALQHGTDIFWRNATSRSLRDTPRTPLATVCHLRPHRPRPHHTDEQASMPPHAHAVATSGTKPAVACGRKPLPGPKAPAAFPPRRARQKPLVDVSSCRPFGVFGHF